MSDKEIISELNGKILQLQDHNKELRRRREAAEEMITKLKADAMEYHKSTMCIINELLKKHE